MDSLLFEPFIPLDFEEGRDSSAARSSLVVENSRVAVTEMRLVPNVGPWVNSKKRRFIDCAVALTALVVFSPVLLLLALMVRLGSRGPILFRQRRMGRNGVEFILYKFRSMEWGGISGSPITVTGDSRITRVGSALRRFKLDELPQFWNVLKGDMSLVGPRPKLRHHEGLHLKFRPGITGAATIVFRREEEVLASIPKHELEWFYERVVKPSKARIDMEYMRRATLRSDLRLLWITGTACFGAATALPTEDWMAEYRHKKAS
jgi:lipopolysaccharide/colanic/teichoic acid biosynthesis glycosyltransferase